MKKGAIQKMSIKQTNHFCKYFIVYSFKKFNSVWLMST
jgi:hypothetical protein